SPPRSPPPRPGWRAPGYGPRASSRSPATSRPHGPRCADRPPRASTSAAPSCPTIRSTSSACTSRAASRPGPTPSSPPRRPPPPPPRAGGAAARSGPARAAPTPRHFQTTWATLRRSPPSGLDLGGTILPDDQIDLVGLYVARGIPAGAYALVTGESPDDYWYVLPITVALAAIAIVFAWALIRAIRRDLLPARAT